MGPQSSRMHAQAQRLAMVQARALHESAHTTAGISAAKAPASLFKQEFVVFLFCLAGVLMFCAHGVFIRTTAVLEWRPIGSTTQNACCRLSVLPASRPILTGIASREFLAMAQIQLDIAVEPSNLNTDGIKQMPDLRRTIHSD
jgi:hypothetical protein